MYSGKFQHLSCLTAAIYFVAAMLTACGSADEKLRYAEFKVSFSAMSHLAQETGAIKHEELDFTPISVAAGPDVVASLRSRSSSAAAAGNLANEPVAAMIGAGASPRIVATVLTSSEDVRLVTFDKTGITTDPRTMGGKKIGLVLDTVGESYLVALLKSAGMSRADVKIVNGRPAELLSALVRGDLDAAILWDPFIAQAPRTYQVQLRAGAIPDRGGVRVLLDPHIFTSRIHIVTTSEHISSQRENLKKFLRALIATEGYIASDRKRAEQEVEQWLGLQAGDLAEFFKSTDFHVAIDRRATEEQLTEVLGRLHEKQPSTEIPATLDPYVDTSLLREIDPSRVR